MALTEVDRKLLKRCLANEPGAWKDFVDRFSGLFVHVIRHTAHARSVPITAEDEDDLLAEIFLKLLENNAQILRRFRQKSSLAWYLTVICRRIAVHEITRRRNAQALGHVSAPRSGTENLPPGSALQVPSNQKQVDDQEEIRQMLEELPPTDAAVVRQYHLEGRSYREIAAILGIAENSIGPTLSRARELLRARKVQSS